MRRYVFYLAVTILAFIIGSFVVTLSYLKTNINVDAIEDPTVRYTKWINQTINQIESENTGFEELSNVKNGDLVTVQESIDSKFLCLDVTYLQPNVCTTILIGNSNEKKSLLIRLPVCSERNKSNCIVWKPDNLCSDNKSCSNKIRIYDNNSKPTDLVEEIQFSDGTRGYYHKSFRLKITARVSIVDNKPRLLTPIEKLEIIEIR